MLLCSLAMLTCQATIDHDTLKIRNAEDAEVCAGTWGFRAVWAYGAAMIGIVLVRTLKRIIFYEARQYSIDSTRHNYLLLALWLFEFPFTWWLALLP